MSVNAFSKRTWIDLRSTEDETKIADRNSILVNVIGRIERLIGARTAKIWNTELNTARGLTFRANGLS